MGMTVHLKRGELAWGWRLSRTRKAPWTPTCTWKAYFLLWLLLFSCSVRFNSLWPHGLQHTRLPCPSPFPGVWSNSCPLNWWCHPTISSFVIPFTSCLQSFPASGSFPISWLFTWGGQIIGASVSASVSTLMNIQGWFSLGLTALIQFLNKGSVPPFLLIPHGPGSRLLFLKYLQHPLLLLLLSHFSCVRLCAIP